MHTSLCLEWSRTQCMPAYWVVRQVRPNRGSTNCKQADMITFGCILTCTVHESYYYNSKCTCTCVCTTDLIFDRDLIGQFGTVCEGNNDSWLQEEWVTALKCVQGEKTTLLNGTLILSSVKCLPLTPGHLRWKAGALVLNEHVFSGAGR